MRKLSIFVILALLVGMLAIVGVVQAAHTSPATLVVNDDASGNVLEPAPCDLVPDFFGPTAIQDAVDHANDGGGDTIKICPGTYAEIVTIAKSDLTLTGDPGGNSSAGPGPDAPVLDGSLLAASSAIILGAGVSGIVIEGLEITGYKNPSYNPSADALCTFSTGGVGSAIASFNTAATDITVQDNWLHDLGWNGVLVASENGTLQSGWLVQRNLVDNVQYAGIELTDVTDSQVLRNEITPRTGSCVIDPGDSGVGIEIANRTQAGEMKTAGTNVLVKHNKIIGDKFDRAGINILSRAYLGASNGILSGVTVERNEVTGGDATGILVTAESRNGGDAEIIDLLIKKNTVKDNKDGIVLDVFLNIAGTPTINFVTIKDNKVENNCCSGNGIVVEGTDNTVEKNKAKNNGNHGIYVPGDNNTIKKNKAENNGVDGINVAGDGNVVDDNKAKKNDANGINVSGDTNTIKKNKAENNGVDGINVAGDGNVVDKNNAKKNDANGINVSGDTNTIKKNKAEKNGADGINVAGDGNAVDKNRAKQNVANGINVSGENNTFDKNKADKNVIWGIIDANADDNTYTKNKCKKNGEGPSTPLGLC